MNYSLLKRSSMIDLISAICAGKAAIISILSVLSGTFLNMIPEKIYQKSIFLFNGSVWWIPPSFGVALQWAAWTIAIFAGIVSIVNGTKNWFKCEEETIKVDKQKKSDGNNE